MNPLRFNFLPNTKKSNNIIYGNYPAPLALLSKHIQTTVKINILRGIPMGFFVSKRKGIYEKKALFNSSKPDSSSQKVSD